MSVCARVCDCVRVKAAVSVCVCEDAYEHVRVMTAYVIVHVCL